MNSCTKPNKRKGPEYAYKTTETVLRITPIPENPETANPQHLSIPSQLWSQSRYLL